ncbi:MAG: hypothetical protein IPM82_13340 [Saprospiraceae bacterium]|nr:hypothetical protein [Saprospiraceae bacterium]
MVKKNVQSLNREKAIWLLKIIWKGAERKLAAKWLKPVFLGWRKGKHMLPFIASFGQAFDLPEKNICLGLAILKTSLSLPRF